MKYEAQLNVLIWVAVACSCLLVVALTVRLALSIIKPPKKVEPEVLPEPEPIVEEPPVKKLVARHAVECSCGEELKTPIHVTANGSDRKIVYFCNSCQKNVALDLAQSGM